ncbi:MAG: acyltransferase [Candidatus Competibacter sp.]
MLRLFAAFSVIMYHYITNETVFPTLSEITKFGYLGVSLFFIISGYVIALSASDRSALEFAISRFARLYPAFWAGLFVTCSISSLFGSKHYTINQILANLTLLNDYLGFENVDGVYWTLQVELKFYGCVFILLLTRLFYNFNLWLSIWLFLTTLYLAIGQPFFMGVFINPHQSCFFIGGVTFYLIQKEGLNKFNIFFLISSLALSSIQGFKQTSDFIINIDLKDKIIAASIIWSFYFLFFLLITEKIKIAYRDIYLILGGLTYPLYLVHNVAGKTLINDFKNTTPEWIVIFVVIILMFLISYLIHVGIEKKFSTPIKRALLATLKKRPNKVY